MTITINSFKPRRGVDGKEITSSKELSRHNARYGVFDSGDDNHSDYLRKKRAENQKQISQKELHDVIERVKRGG